LGHLRPMSAKSSHKPLTFDLLALPETTPGAIYGLYEVFSYVGVAWNALIDDRVESRRIDVRIISPTSEPFTAALGVPIVPDASLKDAPPGDVIVITDLNISPEADPRGRWPAAASWIRDRFEKGAVVCSVCTGTVLLADAGVLDGQEATTHWVATGLFGSYFPAVKLCPERFLSVAGPGDRIITSGGSASWQDLALYLIARYCGEAEALRIAKLFVFGDHSEGQAQYAAMRRPSRHDDGVIAECQEWIADHYSETNPVSKMIAHSGLAARTFKRRFRAATGYAPVEYVQALRMEEAKQVLETTDEPVDAIAVTVGYDDPTFFRRLFKRKTGVTPSRYRQRFQSISHLHTV
jgi:transcriptional regulator GlxA family with amidase domain